MAGQSLGNAQNIAMIYRSCVPQALVCMLQGRCAAVLMFHTQLALLPAMETEGLELDLMMDDPYGEGLEGGPAGPAGELVSATVGNSYIVNLAKTGIKQVWSTSVGLHNSFASNGDKVAITANEPYLYSPVEHWNMKTMSIIQLASQLTSVCRSKPQSRCQARLIVFCIVFNIVDIIKE